METSWSTHLVLNQSPVFGGHNAFGDDPVLRLICQTLPMFVQDELLAHGKWAGDPETLELARLANRHLPLLKTFDSKGNRIDQVEFHPAWHELMGYSIGIGMHASCWQTLPQESGWRHQARAARYYLTAGVEMGHLCPITMTNACVAALVKSPEIASAWIPRITHRIYDPSNLPADQKSQVLLGMGMTEKQGGSDVRTNTTRATDQGNGLWQIVGHKWFLSAPQSDAFLILAQTEDGLSCFLVPRLRSDGSHNGMRLQRLKDKLGNRSNASSEVEFHDSWGQLIGPPGRGIPTIIDMVTLTRLDCCVASAGLMRAALWEAVEHCRHRTAIGQLLFHQPIMRSVLADLTLDVNAASALAFRLARSFDQSEECYEESQFCRLMTPVIKYWNCKIAPSVIYEAMECLGGNGYVEEGNLSRHYREAPLNAIWEGSGNVMCLDVLRVLSKDPKSLEITLSMCQDDLQHSGLADCPQIIQPLKDTIDWIRTAAGKALENPASARVLTERLALLAAGTEMARLGLHQAAEPFIATRLLGQWRSTYGAVAEKYIDPILQMAYASK